MPPPVSFSFKVMSHQTVLTNLFFLVCHNKNNKTIQRCAIQSFRPPCGLQEIPKSPFEFLHLVIPSWKKKV